MARRILSLCCATLLMASVAAAQAAYKIDVRKLNGNDLQALEHKAKRGESRAMTILGMAYAEGKGSVEAAVRWLTRASKVDDVAQTYLAGMYRNGKGVPQDPAQARALYAKAASQGNMVAQFSYASLCYNGEGGPQDVDTAAKFFEIAAREGDPAAQNMIARMYEYGRGVVRDPEQALRWYAKAADQNYGPAALSLGLMYMDGSLVQRDPQRGQRYLERAAASGDWTAALRLANLFLNGDGVARDEAAAFKWFAIARELGGSEVMPQTLSQKLTPAEMASERQEVTQWKAEHFQARK